MMKALLSVVALSALSVGCGTSHGLTYHIAMDPSVTAEEAELVLQSGEAWEKAIPGLKLTYMVAACNTITDEPGNICIVSDDATPLDDSGNMIDGHTDMSHDSSLITLHPVNMANHNHPYHNVGLNTISHELGHALTGSGLHLAAGNLMSAALRDCLTPEQITSADIAYFWAAR